MAVLMKVDGSSEGLYPKNPKRGFILEELYAALQCRTIEVVRLANGSIMVIDEDGKSRQLERNAGATRLARPVLFAADYVVGPALICTRQEFK